MSESVTARPPHFSSQLSILADKDDASKASQWLTKVGGESGIPVNEVTRLDHCLDEALANIMMHGGATALQAPVGLTLDVSCRGHECEAVLTVSDAGFAFNPLEVASKVLPSSLAEAEPGGLGILIMRQHADRLNYRFADNRNHLSFIVCWQVGEKW